MARKAIYMGPRLKKVRRELRLTQADMAADLDISPSYVALMERNQRPVTADLLLKLATTYRIDIADLADGGAEETSQKLETILRQPIFSDIDLPAIDIADISTSYPGFAEALLRLFAANDEAQTALAERRELAGSDPAADPVSEARDFLNAHRNCFPALDDSAALLARSVPDAAAMARHIENEHGLRVEFVPPGTIRDALRFYDYHRRRLMISEWLGETGKRFQLGLQIAMLEQGPAIAAILDAARFTTDNGRRLADQALRSYWAAALLMPYAPFLEAARKRRFDVEALAAEFGVSFEQAAHRLTTLQRKGAEGVPFFFIRVDPAGNISKRLDGAGFPFARLGGSCPLWNVHDCFARAGQLLVQRIELPDGQRFVSIARTVEAGARQFGAQRALRAIALACSEDHLEELVCADALRSRAPAPIGVNCRLCHRPRCVARAAPPIGRDILSDTFLKTNDPFAFAGD